MKGKICAEIFVVQLLELSLLVAAQIEFSPKERRVGRLFEVTSYIGVLYTLIRIKIGIREPPLSIAPRVESSKSFLRLSSGSCQAFFWPRIQKVL